MKTTLVVIISGLTALVSAIPTINNTGFHKISKTSSDSLEPNPRPRIIGGTEPAPHSIPYHVFLVVFGPAYGYYCSGSLISENYVLTSAQCGDGAIKIEVILGAQKPFKSEDTQARFEVKRDGIIVHENWNSSEIVNDIAVIKLPEPVNLTEAIQVISLPKDASDDFAGASAVVSGWSVNDGNETYISDVLNYADDEVISLSECSETWNDLESTIICDSGKETSICDGDIGGPLATTDGVLIGIASFSVPNCEIGYPSGFTRITSYLEWIASNTDVEIA